MKLEKKKIGGAGRPSGSSMEQFMVSVTDSITEMNKKGKKEEGYRFLHVRDVCARTSLSKGQVYHLMATSDFPKSIAISVGRRAWVDYEITEWMDSRKGRDRFRGP